MNCPSIVRSALGLTLLTPIGAVHAQAPGQAAPPRAFVIRRGRDTLVVERVERDASGATLAHLTFRGGGAPAGLRIAATFEPAADGRVRRSIVELTPPGASAPAQRVTLAFGVAPADSIAVQVGDAPVQHVAAPAGALPYLNLSIAGLETILRRARVLASAPGAGAAPVSVPLFVGVGAPAGTATVTRIGPDSTVLSLSGAVEIRLRTTRDDHVLGMRVPSQDIVADTADPRAIDALGAPRPAAPPSYAPPAGAPYAAEEVRVPTPGGFMLGGTLTRPTQIRGPAPVVVTITGSGPEDRDEGNAAVPGYTPFRQLADTLGRRGIAVLRLDDRGVGASGGTFATATSRDFADDVRAALAWLRARAAGRGDVDAHRVALLGHSEGGMIAPLVAAEDSSVVAIALLAGPAYDGRRVLTYQFRREILADSTLTTGRRDSLLRVADQRRDSVIASTPWTRYFGSYDPLVTARRVRVPVLLLQGATDRQVTPEQADTLAAAFRAGGNRDVTVRVLPATNHLFLADSSGAPSGYLRLPSRALRPQVLGIVADWCAAHLGPRVGR